MIEQQWKLPGQGVALSERESLWTLAVGISLFSVELSQFSSQLAKEGRKPSLRSRPYLCLANHRFTVLFA